MPDSIGTAKSLDEHIADALDRINKEADPDGELVPSEPEHVEFPEAYQEGEGREALSETYYKDHLETHWGF